MAIEFTRKAYLEVWCGDRYVSRHTGLLECGESASQDAEEHGPGTYQITVGGSPTGSRLGADGLPRPASTGQVYYEADVVPIVMGEAYVGGFFGSTSIGFTATGRLTEGVAQTDHEAVLNDMQGFADYYNVTGGAGRPLVTVTNLNNSGAGSLRQALADNPSGSWIRFSQGLTGIVQLSTDINWVSNTTIDGRGADITIRGADSGSSPILDATSDQQNFIIMYCKLVGSATVNSGENDDGCRHENSPTFIGSGPDLAHRDDTMHSFWYYHCDLSDSEDELFSVIRSLGRCTIQECNFTQTQLTGYMMLISHGSAGNNYDWEQYDVEISLYRNVLRGRDRTPFITVPSQIHSWNNYYRGLTGGGHIHVTSRYNAPANSANMLSENDIMDAQDDPGQLFIKPTLGSAIDGNAKVTGSRLLSGATNNQRNTSLVFQTSRQPEGTMNYGGVPPYSYTLETADATLEADVLANAGWQSVPFPGD